MNKSDAMQKIIKFFATTKQVVLTIISTADNCYNKLPLDKINAFLSARKIKINVKSKIFKYSLSGCIFLVLIITLLPENSEEFNNSSTLPAETPATVETPSESHQKTQPIVSKPIFRPPTVQTATVSQSVPDQPIQKVKAPAAATVKKETVEEAAQRMSVTSAIEENRCDVIKYLLDNKKININQVIIGGSADVARGMRPNHYLRADEPAPGDTMLMYAVRLKKYQVVDFLLEHGANVDSLNHFKMSALHIAVQSGDFKLCEALLKKTTVINQRNCLDETPLLIAVRNNSMPIVKLLLKYKAKVPANTGGKLLVELIKKNNIESAKILCENGADVSYEVEQSNYTIGSELPVESPITIAIKNDNIELVKYLLEKGAATNGKSSYVRFNGFVHIYVASKNRPDILPLLTYDLPVTTKMLCYAAYYGHIDVMKFLLRQKYDLNRTVAFDELSPLLHMVDRCQPLTMAVAGRQYEAAKLLLEHGANPNGTDAATYHERNKIQVTIPKGISLGYTHYSWDWMLKWQAGICEPKMYKLLADYGREAQNMDIFYAAVLENSELLDQLLRQGVKPPENIINLVEYVVAVKPDNTLKILSLLLDKSIVSADLILLHTVALKGSKDVRSSVPATKITTEDIVSFLLKRNANVNFCRKDPTNDGISVLFYAIVNKHDDILKLLLANNAKMPERDSDILLRMAKSIYECDTLQAYKNLLDRGVKIAIDPDRKFVHQQFVVDIEYAPYVVAKLLIENCEDLNIVPNTYGEKMTLLDYIEPLVKNKQIIKLLRAKGAKKYSELKQDPREQYKLAESYMQGSGVQKDLQMAVYWYRRSAELGYAEAQYKLAECYRQGKWVEKDVKQAEFWYRKAAEQKHAQAQLELNKWAALRERKSVVCGSVLLPCEGEPLDEYRERFHITSAEYEENTGAPLLDYYADGVKAIVIKRRKFQINNGQEPDGVEVKGKDGNVEIYAERTKSTP